MLILPVPVSPLPAFEPGSSIVVPLPGAETVIGVGEVDVGVTPL
jgi:hypothetical protein